MGLRTEIVALANPYTETLEKLPVKVLFEGAPRADAQVELFEMDLAGDVEITLHRTNADGIAEVPIKPGHEYLVDAVMMVPLDPGETPQSSPSWYSLWASLTFRKPDAPLN
jgi:hypothetical protein